MAAQPHQARSAKTAKDIHRQEPAFSRRLSLGAEKGKSDADLRRLLKSPLTRSLVLVAILVALIESAFIATFAYDVSSADKAALREMQLIKLCQSISIVVQKAKPMWDSIGKGAENPQDPKSYATYKRLRGDVLNEINNLENDFKRVGIDAGSLQAEKRSMDALDKMVSPWLQQKEPWNDTPQYQQYLTVGSPCYGEFLKEMEYINSLVSKKVEPDFLFGIAPLNLLYISIAVNLAIFAVLVFLVERSIVGPIFRLSQNCNRILEGAVLPAPAKVSNEIGGLEQSFHEMSKTVQEDIKKRVTYLEILQAVQMSALEKLRSILDLLGKDPYMDKRALSRCHATGDNLDSLIHLVQSMSDALSSKGKEELKAVISTISSDKLIRQSISALDALIQERRIFVAVEGAHLSFDGDFQLLKRVLVNLLSNAIKFSPDSAKVVVKLSQIDERLRISVTDEGPGISDEDAAKLFKKYSQLNSPDGKARGGTGLGLSICKEIIELHQGEIGCSSTVGKGSKFWFEIPTKAPEGAGAKTKASTGESEQSKTRINNGGLKRVFSIMLLSFLLFQSLLAITLNDKFVQSQSRAKGYNEKKAMLIDSHEMLSMFLIWSYKLQMAAPTLDTKLLSEALPMISEQEQKATEVLNEAGKDSNITKETEGIITRLKFIRKAIKYAIINRETAGQITLGALAQKVADRANEMETELFEVIEIQREAIEVSYDWSRKLRSEIFVSLLIAGGVDLILLFAVSIYGLKIIGKISELESKSRDFAAGKQLSADKQGNDELSFLDAQLCAMSSSIREAESERQALMAVISHDLRTPLSAIMLTLELLAEEVYGPLSESAERQVAQSSAIVNRLLKQINDLLMIEKADSGTLKATPAPLDLANFVEERTRQWKEIADAKNLAIVFNNKAGSQLHSKAIADAALLERTLDSLLENAVNASEAKQKIEITLNPSPQESDWLIRVEDHGPGIEEELAKQIFERFRYLDGRPLTGIGLPLAYRLSRLQGASLSISSKPSQGTFAEIVLPLAQA